MCGIAGLWGLPGTEEALRETAARMGGTLMHRGPDDDGTWVDGAAGIGLGFRRLAIVDVSPEGCQPMRSASGRYVVVFNGEIYNFPDLRTALEDKGHRFRGHSDTEVLLASVEEWGLLGALERFQGMFAFALWDRRERTLALARDRIGIKPLYYGRTADGTLLFGSELKALRAHPGFSAEVDRGALSLHLRHGYVFPPSSIYRGIHQLPPGQVLALDDAAADLRPAPYWSAREVAERGVAYPLDGTAEDAVRQLDALLRDAVRAHMIADVPLGAFLSGGIDSSTVVALMQAQSQRPVKTFSIGFHEAGYDEATHARAVARHLGTEHTELYVTPREAMDVIPRLPEMYDEPFADPSQIPTHLVSALARRHVTVSLSGDGGDELFGGYNRYFIAHPLWRRLRWLPTAVRRGLAGAVLAAPPEALGRLLAPPLRLAGRSGLAPVAGEKLQRFAELLPEESAEGLYRRLVSHWQDPARVVIGAVEPATALSPAEDASALADFRERMMYLDLVTYLPGDILVKLDRASMAASLEARVPLLDHRVVEFAWRVPVALKFGEGGGKWLLRQVLYRYVPRPLIDRPKMGFGVPIDAWLRGPLREWAEELLGEARLRREDFLHPGPVRRAWEEHLRGTRNRQYLLWNVLMFQAWHECWMTGGAGAAVVMRAPAAADVRGGREYGTPA